MADLSAAIAAARDALEGTHPGNDAMEHGRTELRALLAALDAAQGEAAAAWPKADDSAKELGWSWDYKWLESLADATRAAGWDASMEAIDFVLSRVAHQAPPAAVAVSLSQEALLLRIKELQDANAELERLCEATYVQQGADAYNHATDILTDWQEARVAAGLDPGAQMSLCDGLGRLIQMLEEAEAKQAPPAAVPWLPNRLPNIDPEEDQRAADYHNGWNDCRAAMAAAPAGVSEAGTIELLRRALPFLYDAAKPYADDGANEPLEIARDIEAVLDEVMP